jgi:hypothetical protein
VSKNLCAKTVTRENAYEVWQSPDEKWTWYVLKKWQTDDAKPGARWFCLVTSPHVGDDGEYGDCWVTDVTTGNKKIVDRARKEED